MLIENDFEVPVGVDEVWAALLDLERIAPCLPGASIDENRGEGEFGGSMRIKLGPVTSVFKGTLRIEEADETAHRAVIDASARDTRGQGAAAATITSVLESAGSGTKVSVTTDMKLAGTAAQFGRGVVSDVSEKMLGQFAVRLSEELQHPSERPVSMDAGEGDARPAAQPASSSSPRPARDTADDVMDLGAASRDAVLKRAAPFAAGLAVLGVLAAMLRGGSRRSTGRRRPGSYIVVEGPLLVIQRGGRKDSK